jgi:hypothetical protein
VIQTEKSKTPPVTRRDRWATRKFKPAPKGAPPAKGRAPKFQLQSPGHPPTRPGSFGTHWEARFLAASTRSLPSSEPA